MKKIILVFCLLMFASGQINSQIFVNTTSSTNNTDPTFRMGSVAIGKNTAATEMLDVNGSIVMPFGYFLGVSNTTYKKILQTNWNSTVGDFLSFYTPGNSAGSSTEKMTILANGNVGIGYTAPEAKLHVLEPAALNTAVSSKVRLASFSGNAGGNYVSQSTWLYRSTSGPDWLSTSIHDGISVDGSFKDPGSDTRTWWRRQPYLDVQSWGHAGTSYMSLEQGKLCIGTKRSVAHANALLSVDGKVVCKDLYVTASSDWPDFVFDSDYKLANLYDVRDYFKTNKHLPDVPTACEIEEKGINMSEMSSIQMQKIEELTLYIIQLKTELDELKKTVKNN